MLNAKQRVVTDAGAVLLRCYGCGAAKPAEDFYRRSGTDGYLTECKDCMKARGKTFAQRRVPDDVSTVATENDVIAMLAAYGIPAIPGKALAQKWVDIVAWGCVNIEVKSATMSGKQFRFRMTPKQKAGDVRGDLIVLVCKFEDRQTYHVFRADDPIFFRGGKRREMIGYTFHAKHRKSGVRGGVPLSPLTDERMNQARDAWRFVEVVRREKSAALKAQKPAQTMHTQEIHAFPTLLPDLIRDRWQHHEKSGHSRDSGISKLSALNRSSRSS